MKFKIISKKGKNMVSKDEIFEYCRMTTEEEEKLERCRIKTEPIIITEELIIPISARLCLCGDGEENGTDNQS